MRVPRNSFRIKWRTTFPFGLYGPLITARRIARISAQTWMSKADRGRKGHEGQKRCRMGMNQAAQCHINLVIATVHNDSGKQT